MLKSKHVVPVFVDVDVVDEYIKIGPSVLTGARLHGIEEKHALPFVD